MAIASVVPSIVLNPTPLDGYDPQPDAVGSTPFTILLDSIDPNTGVVNVKITPYSYLLQNFDIVNNIPVLGLDYGFPIAYGQKVYLQVYYDRNGNPFCPKIKTATKWHSLTVQPGGTTPTVQTYPNTIELITSADISAKIDELTSELADNTVVYNACLAAITTAVTNNEITSTQAAAKTAKLTSDFTTLTTGFQTYINQFANFFAGTSGVNKKLFKTFTMIGYTTKDLSGELPGITIIPATTTPSNANQVQSDPAFKIVQCVQNDLMIVDVCYNQVGCRYPIPFHRPVYFFNQVPNQSSAIEDVINTTN